MIATLQFDLPADEVDYRLSVNANRLARAVYDIAAHLRSRRKYAELSAEAILEVEAAEQVLRDADISDLLDL